LEGKLRSRPEQMRFLKKLAGVGKPARPARKKHAAKGSGDNA